MMKNIGALVVILVLLLTGCAQEEKPNTHNVYELKITATLLSNHSVGNDWVTRYTCNGEPMQKTTRLLLPIGTTEEVKVEATIIEQDKYPESGTGTLSASLCDGVETSTLITVKENRGRYKGHTATWEIVCTVTLVEQVRL